MAYDFNAVDSGLNDVPNPFAIENKLLLTAAAVFAAGGIYALMTARNLMAAHADGAAFGAALASLSMLAVAAKMAIQALTQLRFLFGRGFPVGLAPELKHDQRGTSQAATDLQHQLRERAIRFAEPSGPLAGLLYSLFKPLSSAPPVIQYAAQRQFEAFVTMAAVLLSMCLSYVLFNGSPHEGVVSWFYLPLTGLSLIKPFTDIGDLDAPRQTRWVLVRLLALLVFAVLGPVIMARFIPAFAVAPMWAAPGCLLIGSLGASAWFFAAVLSHIDNVSQTAVSCEQTTIAMNCQPAQLLTAISRDFQEAWARGIPNRQYTSLAPEAADTKGSFSGSVLEETQPVTTNMLEFTGLFEGLKHPGAKALVFLGFWGVLLAMGAAATVAFSVPGYGAMDRMEISRSLLTMIAFETAALLAFRISHLLWSRLYFKSRVTWIEVQGTYQTADLDVGNVISGNARSRATVIRVEDATLRVWCSDITTIAFGKAGKRSVIAMAPADSTAASIARRLQEFAAMQSMIVAPTSTRDIDKAKVLNGLGRLMNSKKGISPGKLAGAVATLQDQAVNDAIGAGQLIEASVKFYDPSKDFGYLRTREGKELRFTSASFGQGVKQLSVGDRVLFMASANDAARVVEQIRMAP